LFGVFLSKTKKKIKKNAFSSVCWVVSIGVLRKDLLVVVSDLFISFLKRKGLKRKMKVKVVVVIKSLS